MDDKDARDRPRPQTRPEGETGRRAQRSGHRWVDDAADARTSDDPRARTPKDATGRPSTRPFDE